MKGKLRNWTKKEEKNQTALKFPVSRFIHPSHQPLLPGWVHAALTVFRREAAIDQALVMFLSLTQEKVRSLHL